MESGNSSESGNLSEKGNISIIEDAFKQMKDRKTGTWLVMTTEKSPTVTAEKSPTPSLVILYNT